MGDLLLRRVTSSCRRPARFARDLPAAVGEGQGPPRDGPITPDEPRAGFRPASRRHPPTRPRMGFRMPRRDRSPGRSAGPLRTALHAGEANARLLLAESKRMQASLRRPRAPRPGEGRPLIVAEGDSWFDYPLFDVLDALEDGFGYEVESVAHAGDTLESMAYEFAQLHGFIRVL